MPLNLMTRIADRMRMTSPATQTLFFAGIAALYVAMFAYGWRSVLT